MDQFSYVLNFKHLASLNVFEALTKHSATVKNTKGTLFDVIYILSDRYHEVNQVATSSWRVYIYISHSLFCNGRARIAIQKGVLFPVGPVDPRA